MIGCEPGSCAQSSLLIPESISEQPSGTCCVRDAHRILLFVLVVLIAADRRGDGGTPHGGQEVDKEPPCWNFLRKLLSKYNYITLIFLPVTPLLSASTLLLEEK